MKKEVWLLDTDYKNENVEVRSSGMCILTSQKDSISVGYSAEDRLERFRLISASPELLELVNIAKKLINSDYIKDWQKNQFNQELKLVENKIKGSGEIKAPLHCRFTYEWKDEHIENYHKKVESIKYKL